MKIEEAIAQLIEEKANGTQSIVLAYWKADLFCREDDEGWHSDTELLESETDWSRVHDQMIDIISENDADDQEEDEPTEPSGLEIALRAHLVHNGLIEAESTEVQI
jgi:hypothetical protein